MLSRNLTRTVKGVFFLHLLIFFIRFLFLTLGPGDLYTEEAQYWLWSNKLDLSYYSKPPLIAYFNYLSTSVLGSNEFAIKINASLLGFVFSILTFRFTKEIFQDHSKAVLASFLVYALPLNHLIFNVFLTDTPLMVFWALATVSFWRAIHDDKSINWVLVGVFAGLGFLSKYTMVLFAPIGLVFLFLFRKDVLTNKWLYVSLAIAVLFMIPVIAWNYSVDFVTLKHVSSIGKKTLTIGKRLSFFGEYLGGQISFISPFLFIFLIFSWIRAIKQKSKTLIYLSVFPLLVFLFFLLYSFTKRVEANWPFFAYFTIPILLADYAVELKKRKTVSVLAYISIGLTILIFYLSPYLQGNGLERILPPKRDPVVRLYGWEKLGKEVQAAIDKLNTDRYFIFSDTYQVACEVAFYTKDQRLPYNINLGRRKNQFDLWKGIQQFENQGYIGIYVSINPKIPKVVEDGFDQVLRTDHCEIELGGEVIKTFVIATMDNLKHISEVETSNY